MRRSAILAAAAIILASPSQSLFAQPLSPAAQAINAQVDALFDRWFANSKAEGEAIARCDLDQLRSVVKEYGAILDASNKLLDAARATPGAQAGRAHEIGGYARSALNGAARKLAELEDKCPKSSSQPSGGAGAVAGPPTQPLHDDEIRAAKSKQLADLLKLYRDAQKEFAEHSAAAAVCDVTTMRNRRNALYLLYRDALAVASKARQKGLKGTMLDQANRYEQAILALYQAALAQYPRNCPTAVQPPPPPPPQPPEPPGRKSQDCPVPGGVPGGSIAPGNAIPEHGMRFTPPDQNSQRMLAAHNRARAEVGVPPLTWDRELAAGAAGWAAQMSKVGRAHAPRLARDCVRENLLQSLRGGRSPEQMVGVWTSERVYFKPGIFPNVSTTGDWAKVGHYTQIVWRNTTHVGCATHSGSGYDWTVCRYSPPGNQDGKSVLAPPPVTKQPLPSQPVPIPYPPSQSPTTPTG